ncbi:MAG: hypothetical protein U0793_04210 [Gemmataceae bacterium]
MGRFIISSTTNTVATIEYGTRKINSVGRSRLRLRDTRASDGGAASSPPRSRWLTGAGFSSSAVAEDGAAEDGAAEDGATEDGATEDGATAAGAGADAMSSVRSGTCSSRGPWAGATGASFAASGNSTLGTVGSEPKRSSCSGSAKMLSCSSACAAAGARASRGGAWTMA